MEKNRGAAQQVRTTPDLVTDLDASPATDVVCSAEMDGKNKLYFGHNLQILSDKVADSSVDLIYLDPPFTPIQSRYEFTGGIHGRVYMRPGAGTVQRCSAAFVVRVFSAR
jgi:hypothetical protein